MPGSPLITVAFFCRRYLQMAATSTFFEGGFPPGDGYISHRKGKGKSSTQNAHFLGGYVSSLDGSCFKPTVLQGSRFAKNPGPLIRILGWVTCPPNNLQHIAEKICQDTFSGHRFFQPCFFCRASANGYLMP